MRKSVRLQKAQAVLGISFRDPSLLDHALTPQRIIKGIKTVRLEAAAFGDEAVDAKRKFQLLAIIGDRLIGLCLAAEVWKRGGLPAGRHWGLVQRMESNETLARLCDSLNLTPFLNLKYRGGDNPRSTHTKASVFEAIVGAIYLDRGLATARAFAFRTFARDQSTRRGGRSSKQ